MTTLRLKLNTRLFMLGMLIFMSIGIGWEIYLFSGLQAIGLGVIDLLIFSIPILFVVLVAWIGFITLSNWKYRIEIDETMMQSHVLLQFPLKSFKFAFTDVAHVQSVGIRGILEIILNDGKQIRIAPDSLEGGTKRFLAELSLHIQPDKFQPDLAVALRKSSNWDYWLSGVSIVFILFVFYYLFSTFGVDIIRSQVAWKAATRLPVFSSVEGFSVDPDNTAWLIVGNYGRSKFNVYQIKQEKIQKWDLPSNGSPTEYMDAVVSGDNQEQPVVIYRNGILHFQDNAWHLTALPPKYEPLDLEVSYRGDFVIQDNVWLVTKISGQETTELLKLDLVNGSISTIPLPDMAKQQGLAPETIRQAPNGEVLVLMSGEAGDWIYLLHEKGWKQNYPVSNPEHTWIRDFSLDGQGQVWVLCQNILDEDGFVERISPSSEIVKTFIPTNSNSGYETIVADAHGRIWAANGFPHTVTVFEPVWGENARTIIQYNDQNSGYQPALNATIVKGPDGRIWAADDALVWIDSNVQELPQTLPYWLANLKSLQALGVFMIFYVIVCAVYVGVTIIHRRKMKL
jgi:streptogramin lyase